MTKNQEPVNRKSILSFQEEIDYLREENHAKTRIIKQLTDMKVAPSNSGITTDTCSCKVASTYRVDNNYKEPSIDLDINTKSNKNLDKIKNQHNKNITEKLDFDNINEKNKK